SSENLVDVAKTGHTRRSAAICAYRNSGINALGRLWEPPMRATMARNERYKLTLYSSGGEVERELFDLSSDPQETSNLTGAPQYAPAETALLTELAAFLDAEAAQALPRATTSLPNASQ